MVVEKDNIIAIEFSLCDAAGNLLDGNEGFAPLEYLHGSNNIIPGLEKALEGLQAGDRTEVTVMPEDAYGNYDQQLVYALPAGRDEMAACQPGDLITLEDGKEAVVTKAGEGSVIVDANHPLAGKTLLYRVKITAIRKAREEELLNGFPVYHQHHCTGETGCC